MLHQSRNAAISNIVDSLFFGWGFLSASILNLDVVRTKANAFKLCAKGTDVLKLMN